MTVPTDDDVIVDGDAERGGDVDDGAGHLDIRLRRCRVAGRMVMHDAATFDYCIENKRIYWGA